jgi:hypothetical protein
MGIANIAGIIRASYFINAFGGYGDEYATCVYTDGPDVYVFGQSASYGPGDGAILLLKTDSSGHFCWARTIGASPGFTGVRSITRAPQGGFHVVGLGDYDGFAGMFVVLVTDDGIPLWARFMRDGVWDARGMVGNQVFGYSFGYDPFLLEIDRNTGDLLWAKKFVGPDVEAFLAGTQLEGGGMAFAGVSGPYNEYDILLAKTDASGNLLWAKSYHIPGLGYAFPAHISQIPDGRLWVLAEVAYTINYPHCILNMVLDTAGNPLVVKLFSSDKTLRIFGPGFNGPTASAMGGLCGDDLLMLKMEPGANPTWATTFPYDGGQRLSYATFTPGGFYAVGETETLDRGRDMIVLRADTTGNIPGCLEYLDLTCWDTSVVVSDLSLTQQDITPVVETVQIYAKDVFMEPVPLCQSRVEESRGSQPISLAYFDGFLRLGLGQEADVRISVYDPVGRLVKNLFSGKLEAGEHEFPLGLDSKGVYLVVVKHPGGTRTLKVVW